MKTSAVLAAALLFTAASSFAAAPAAPAAPAPSPEFIELRNTKCTLCHTNERFEKKHFTEAEWNSILDSMLTKGLKLDANQLEVLRAGGKPK
jgi:hypothetical protein